MRIKADTHTDRINAENTRSYRYFFLTSTNKQTLIHAFELTTIYKFKLKIFPFINLNILCVLVMSMNRAS